MAKNKFTVGTYVKAVRELNKGSDTAHFTEGEAGVIEELYELSQVEQWCVIRSLDGKRISKGIVIGEFDSQPSLFHFRVFIPTEAFKVLYGK